MGAIFLSESDDLDAAVFIVNGPEAKHGVGRREAGPSKQRLNAPEQGIGVRPVKVDPRSPGAELVAVDLTTSSRLKDGFKLVFESVDGFPLCLLTEAVAAQGEVQEDGMLIGHRRLHCFGCWLA